MCEISLKKMISANLWVLKIAQKNADKHDSHGWDKYSEKRKAHEVAVN